MELRTQQGGMKLLKDSEEHTMRGERFKLQSQPFRHGT